MLYKNAYVYKLSLPNSPLIYYGSTTKTINNRFKQHQLNYKKYKTGSGNHLSSYKLFDSSRSPVIELMQELTNVTKQQLLECERFYIENNECVNVNIPYRSYAEKLAYSKQYHRQNFTHINDRKNSKVTCNTCNCSVSRTNITHHYKSKKHQNLINI